MQTILLVALLITVAAVLVLLLRKPDKRVELAIREDRERLAADLERERNARQSAVADAARLAERAAMLAKAEQDLAAMRTVLQDSQQTAAEAQAGLAAQTSARQQDELHRAAVEAERDALRDERDTLRAQLAERESKLSHSERSKDEMRAFLDSAQARLSGAFAELASKAFDERTRQATLQSKNDIDLLLKPFAEQLAGFRQRVDILHGEDTRQRATLVGRIDELKSLNQDMAQRAHELTRALRGNAKVRGDWGELMLENVLQGSGLVEGEHYQRQQSATTDEGDRQRPDIVVKLPDDRQIVVDSKVNLIAWQEAMNADTPDAQQDALRRHAVGLRQHVRDLGGKNYPKTLGESTLEVTIAFVPIEGALSAALGFDGSLQTYAFEQKIVFASPNTLMALLRVVERLWTRDKIQREASEIARMGGLVLDALTNFMSDFDRVGKQLDDAHTAFRAARGKLSESNQALFPRARRLVELGAKGKKALPAELRPDPDALPGPP